MCRSGGGGSTPRFRHRSGSLESQPRARKDGEGGGEGDVPAAAAAGKPVFTLSPAHRNRSCSSEALDDCSSYASQSSLDYCLTAATATTGGAPPHYCTLDSRHTGPHPHHRLHRRLEVYGNSGSMPNLVPHHHHSGGGGGGGGGGGYAYESPPRYRYPGGPDAEPYANGGAYVFESEVEGHYNVNPSYQAVNGYHGHGYHGETYRRYGERSDGLSQNPYATMRPPRSRQGPRHELLAKSMQKALVEEHLRGWFHRSGAQKEPGRGPDYDSGSQLSLGYQTLPAPSSLSSRANSYSSGRAAAGAWNNMTHNNITHNNMTHNNMTHNNTTHNMTHNNTTHNNTTHNNMTNNNMKHNNMTHNNTTHNNTTHNNTTHNNMTHNNMTHNNMTHNNMKHNNIAHNNMTRNNMTHNNMTHNNMTRNNMKHIT